MNRHGSLNRIYRLVWSQVTNSWVAVAENVKGRGKGKNTARKLVAAALALSAVTWLLPEAVAGPTNGSVAKGAAQISQSGATTIITQATQYALLNWGTFNVASNETVNFNQLSTSSVAVNQIHDTNGSSILGHLNAKGEIFLINPNGIVFGKDAVVNVGGLVASALAVSSTDSSGIHFSIGTASVINHGTISAGSHVVLLGSSVFNDGTITTAPLGTIILGAGNSATLTMNNSQVSLKIDGSTVQNLISNGGLIQADGGTILLTAGAASDLMSGVVNTGVIQARTVGNNNGTISLLADMQSGTVKVGGTLDASAPDGGNGGKIETSAAGVKMAQQFTVNTRAASGNTGSWLVDPTDFTIAASGGDISGQALNAVLASSDVTISTNSNVPCSGVPCTAINGSINVNDTTNPVTWADHSLTLNAAGDININAPMNLTGSGALALLFGQGATVTGNASSINIAAPVNLDSAGHFSTRQGYNGATLTYKIINSLGQPGDATKAPATPTLQGMATDLGGFFVLGSNIDASKTSQWNGGFMPVGYGLPGSSYGDPFLGVFNGLGHTISGLSMRQQIYSSGLFSMTGPGSSVSNVGIVGGNIIGPGVGIAGMLAGINYGVIESSFAAGSITGTPLIGGLVGVNYGTVRKSFANVSVGTESLGFGGGLVGWNAGTISDSYATGNVNSVTEVTVGGLTAVNGGSISNSYATGKISADQYSQAGGLVGWNFGGTVSHSVWDKDTTGIKSSSDGTGLSDAQMKDQANFVAQGWDFVNIWTMPPNPGYPVLRSIPNDNLLGSPGSPPPPPGKPPKCHFGHHCRNHWEFPGLAARFTELDFYFLRLLVELKSTPDKTMLLGLQIKDGGVQLPDASVAMN